MWARLHTLGTLENVPWDFSLRFLKYFHANLPYLYSNMKKIYKYNQCYATKFKKKKKSWAIKIFQTENKNNTTQSKYIKHSC